MIWLGGLEVLLVDLPMGFQALFLVFLAFCSAILAQESEDVRIIIDTNSTVANTDANYICATIDWWPKDKCEYNRCPWGSSSVINLVSGVDLLIRDGAFCCLAMNFYVSFSD